VHNNKQIRILIGSLFFGYPIAIINRIIAISIITGEFFHYDESRLIPG